MDDQQGHVIDGTERARQWRRSQTKAGSAPDVPETRSDAPKSFAGSLLVPADLLPAAFAPDERLNETPGRPVAPTPRADADSGIQASAENGAHQNPFLIPEAAGIEYRARPTRWRVTAALLASPHGLIAARRGSSRPLRRLAPMPRRMGERRLTRLLALAVLTGAVVVTAVIATRPNATHPSSASALGATGSLLTFQTGSLSVASNPFAKLAAARDRVAHRARRVRAHRTVVTRRRPRPAARKPAVHHAQYTPPSDTGTSAQSSATPSYAAAATTTAPSLPTPSGGGGTTGSSSSASSRPAFGENGTLGPGRGAPGTQ